MSALVTKELAGAMRKAKAQFNEGFQFQAFHVYSDLDGKPLYWRLRLKHGNTGEKWIRPFMLTDNGLVQREPQIRGRKPLYRLPGLQADQQAVVLVTEGEFKADRLAQLGLTATTSGGATSADKADWSPLAGREVMIWPDNDLPGKSYADAVAAQLRLLECSVRVVDVDQLSLKEKGDAVDWLDANPTATAAAVLNLACLAGASQARFEELGGAVDLASINTFDRDQSNQEDDNDFSGFQYQDGSFRLTANGLFHVRSGKSISDKSTLKICSPLHVIAKTRNMKSAQWGRLLEWHDDDHVQHAWAMPLELLEGDGVEMRKELASRGLTMSPAHRARELLNAYIKLKPVTAMAKSVNQLGWHDGVYAMPDETVGGSGEPVVFQNPHAVDPAFAARGTAEEWKSTVAKMVSGNSRLEFAISAAFAGPLGGLLGEDSGGFHIRGRSSTGKSTALKLAASVWGNPSDFVRSWRATANGLEGLAALHNDGILILDELSQCDPQQAGEAAYMLANGKGKSRAGRNGGLRSVSTWRVLLLSAGEESLSALTKRDGGSVNVGQELRMADFEADAGLEMGIFEQLPDALTPAGLVMKLRDAAIRSHGAVGQAFLKLLVDRADQLKFDLEKRVRDLAAEWVPAYATGQVERVGRRFALVAVAGELATGFGLTGWPKGRATAGTRACFDSWLDGFGGIGDREERALLGRARELISKHGSSRFQSWDAGDDVRIFNRAGFYRDDPANGKRVYYVYPSTFKEEICAGFDIKAGEKLFIKMGWLIPGNDGRSTQKPRLPGVDAPTRMYAFGGAMWHDKPSEEVILPGDSKTAAAAKPSGTTSRPGDISESVVGADSVIGDKLGTARHFHTAVIHERSAQLEHVPASPPIEPVGPQYSDAVQSGYEGSSPSPVSVPSRDLQPGAHSDPADSVVGGLGPGDEVI